MIITSDNVIIPHDIIEVNNNIIIYDNFFIMGISKNIKIALLEKNLKVGELATKMNMDPKVLSVKLSRDTMNLKSIEQIADCLNCDVVLRDRETGQIF